MTAIGQSAAAPNERKMILAGVFYGVVGGEAFIVQPGFVQGMTSQLSFSDQQAGYAASAEMFGFAAATIALIYLTTKLDWRRAMAGALTLMVAGNLASLLTQDFAAFAITRFIAGLGGGSVVSLGFATLGMTRNPDRNFGFMVMSAMIFGAIVLFSMPTAYDQFGMPSVLLFFAAFAAIGFLFVGGVPKSGEQQEQVEEDAVNLSMTMKVLALAAMLSYFLAQGGVWAYLGLIGEEQGAGEQQIANALTLSQFTGIIGAFSVTVLGARIGRFPPLAFAIACGIAPLMLFLFGAASATIYLIGVLIYNFGFNMAHPYLLATMASFDRTGRVVVFAVAAQTLGMAFGPAIAASIVGESNVLNVGWYGAGFFLLALILILPPAMAQARLASKTSSAAS